MDLKDIQELIKFVAKSGATEVDLEIDNIKISIKSPAKKRRGAVEEPAAIIQQAPPVTPATMIQQAPPATIVDTTDKTTIVSEKGSPEDDNSNYITIKASMIGTFYRSTSPENPPFVNVGDSINEGETLCIIEAMKLFNEIESEVSGKIVKVLVDDATPIEFDQPLFLVDPS
ncbi:acetyl-CoA carboxylase biotin carboxyl carrier protein [Flavobacteriales bacterium]|nr:acetyl-CoA carboxylase biotin carboxyl carrier protein [Flavobacteriales bacterium]